VGRPAKVANRYCVRHRLPRNERGCIRYGTGIDAIGDLLDKAAERDVVKKAGAYYSFENTNIGQGRERAREALVADPALRELIQKRLTALAPATAPPQPKAARSEDVSVERAA